MEESNKKRTRSYSEDSTLYDLIDRESKRNIKVPRISYERKDIIYDITDDISNNLKSIQIADEK